MNLKHPYTRPDQVGILIGILLMIQSIFDCIESILFPFTTLSHLLIIAVIFYFSAQWIKNKSKFTPLFSFFLPYFLQNIFFVLSDRWIHFYKK